MKFLRWFGIRDDKETYFDKLGELIQERHKLEAILEHIKKQLGKNSSKLDWSDAEYKKEWHKYYGGVESIILESHRQEYEQGLKEIYLVGKGRGIKKKLAELEQQISQHIHQMMDLGFVY